MAALVQTIPQQAGSSITLLSSPRPASSGSLTSSSSPSSHHNQQQQHHHHHHSPHQQMARTTQHHPRTSHGGGSSSSTVSGHRPSPVAPYAFTSTPSLATRPSQPRPDSRANSSPSASQGQAKQQQLQHGYPGVIPSRGHHFAAGSVSSYPSSSSSSVQSQRSKDDSALSSRPRAAAEPGARPLSAVDLSLPPLSFTTTAPASPAKPSPDRYRRGQRQQQHPHNIATPQPATTTASPSLFPSDRSKLNLPHHTRGASADDVQIQKPPSPPELAKRYRRRSLGSLDTAGLANFASSEPSPSFQTETVLSSPDSLLKDGIPPALTSNPGRPGSSSASSEGATSQTSTLHKSALSIPTSKRPTNPSPLSNRLSMSQDDPSPPAPAETPKDSSQEKTESPAAKQLTEISKKSKGKSRLRRALSFSSVAELRSASESDSSKSRKQQLDEELGAEQAAIAQQQEASGLGENIYSNIFANSTDNLSVSSTASSASIMLRKMGKGMKRSTRSLVGLFRPKSSHRAAAEPPAVVEPMTPQVSMVTVEAQRTKLTTPREPANGRVTSRDGPVDQSSDSDQATDNYRSRKSIIGSDKERAEVLAAVRKGILKKTGSNSPVVRPADPANVHIPPFADTPRSSAPSTPTETSPRVGHRRTDSVTIEGDDFVLPGGRFHGSEANGSPATPHSGVKKAISFSPRIQFHDTWPSAEYDRRGDIATCNRLTPLLAQQIKEELNSFKMEMEVHESSKIYTHFF
ncbi:hypothetical protein VTO42DRAFT_3319 [Malbranchea cinnamomea]